MITVRRTLVTFCLVTFASCALLAQGSKSDAPPVAKTSALTITMAATAERARFAAPGAVVRMRVEVYSEAGETLFDATSKGNVFDWSLADSAGQRVPDGTYLCVVTAKTLGGKLSQRIGHVTVQGQQVTVSGAQTSQLSAAQQQAVGPVEEHAALTVLAEGDVPAATVVAHDGRNGQVTSTQGALTFRTGDVFSGKDSEGMRLTEEGNLGIGTDNPQTRLDVNGMIRARDGFQFADGSILNLAPKGGLRVTLPSGATMPVQFAPAAPSTLNRLPKFIDGGSSLGDSALFESNGFIGWGTTTPAHPFTVQRNGGSAGVHSFGELYVNRDDRNRSASMILGTGGQLKWIFGMPYQNDGFQIFDLLASPAPGASRFYVHPTSGNVGIGTTTPAVKLTVQTASGNYGFTHTDGTITVGSYVGSSSSDATGGWLGTLSNHKLLFFTNNGQPSMTVDTTGNVGIGTSPTIGKLHVIGNASTPAIYGESANRGVWGKSTGSSYGVYGESVNGIGMQGVSTNNIGVVGSTAAGSNVPGVYGVSGGNDGVGVLGEANTGNGWGVHGRSTSASTTSIGVYGGSTNGMGLRGDSAGANGYGVYANNPAGMALGVQGNATQSLTHGGLVKAMIHVNADGSIARCYNSQLLGNVPSTGTPRASTLPCNFTVTRAVAGGDYIIRFGFRVNDRFYSLTLGGTGFVAAQVNNYDSFPFLGVNELEVFTYNNDAEYVDAPFTLIVY